MNFCPFSIVFIQQPVDFVKNILEATQLLFKFIDLKKKQVVFFFEHRAQYNNAVAEYNKEHNSHVERRKLFTALVNGVVDLAEGAVDLASDLGGALIDGVTYIGTQTINGIKYVAGKVVDAAEFAAHRIVDAANTIAQLARGALDLLTAAFEYSYVF